MNASNLNTAKLLIAELHSAHQKGQQEKSSKDESPSHQLPPWPGPFVTLSSRRWGFNIWVGKILWRRAWQPTPVSLPGKSHRQRSLAGYSPWSRKELDMTKVTEHTHVPVWPELYSRWERHGKIMCAGGLGGGMGVWD